MVRSLVIALEGACLGPGGRMCGLAKKGPMPFSGRLTGRKKEVKEG